MKTTGYLVSSTAEFTAGMQNGKYNLYCRDARFVVDTYGNASTVIDNGNGVVFVDKYLNFRTKTGQCFINGVIYDLIDQMMKTSGRSTSSSGL